MRHLQFALCATLLLGLHVAFAADEAEQERLLRKAQIQLRAGDYKPALVTCLAIAHNAVNDDLRDSAMSRLEEMGVERQESFQLDPQQLQGEKLGALLIRIEAFRRTQHVHELALEHASDLLQLCIAVRTGAENKPTLYIDEKLMVQALTMMLDAALASGPAARQARDLLMEHGISGAKAEVVRKSANATLPKDLALNVAIEIAAQKLREYQGWKESADDEEESALRRELSTQLGAALARSLRDHSALPSYKKNVQTIEYWPINPDKQDSKF